MAEGRHSHVRDTNVISLAGARKQASQSTRTTQVHKPRARGSRPGPWLSSLLLVGLAMGGVLTLAAPLLRAAGIVGN